MALGDLAYAMALAAVVPDCSMVEFQSLTADVLVFEPGAPHPAPQVGIIALARCAVSGLFFFLRPPHG